MTPSKTPKPPRGKRAVKKTDAAQKQRFVEMAKKLGGDEDPDAYDRAFNKRAKSRQVKPPSK